MAIRRYIESENKLPYKKIQLTKKTDLLIKSKSVFKNELNVPDMKLEMSGKTLLIDEEKFPVDVLGRIETRIKELIPEISKVMLKKDFNPAAKKTAEIKSEKKAPEKK